MPTIPAAPPPNGATSAPQGDAVPYQIVNPPRRKYGDRAECSCCGLDIEWGGRRYGWTDRGGNRYCDTGGGAKYDADGCPVPLPHRRHAP